jgi:hypothetical protein
MEEDSKSEHVIPQLVEALSYMPEVAASIPDEAT